MKKENFSKTNKELEKEMEKNNEQIMINNERKRISSVNQFEYKAGITLTFSLLPYLGLIIILAILTNKGMISSLIRTIPIESFPLLIVGSSLGIGTIGRKILEWKYRTKDRLKAFTTASTELEKIEEEVKCAIESEKAKNRNKVLKHAIDLLNGKQSLSNPLFSNDNLSNRTMPQQESQNRIKELTKQLKDEFTQLDILTTQKILHENFSRIRTRGQKIIDTILAGMIGGFFTMMYGEIPLLIIKDFITSSKTLSLFPSLIIGIVGVSGYMIKRNKDYIRAFHHLNNELGENALPPKIKETYEEQQELDAKLERKIREISLIETELQEQKRAMEAFSTSDNAKEETKEPSTPRQHAIIENNLIPIMETGTERESQEETSLTLKRKNNNPTK